MSNNLIIHNKDWHTYLDSKNKEVLNLFFENNDLKQLQIILVDENPQIKNKTLIIKPKQKNNVISSSHEKHFRREGKEIIEYYYDDILDHYAEIVRLDNIKKIECFGQNGKFISRIIIEYDNNGKPIKEKQHIKNLDGSVLEYEGPL